MVDGTPKYAPGAYDDEATKRAKENAQDLWDRTAAWLADHGALPVLAVLTLVVAAIHFHLFWGEPVGDDLSFHFAESARLADCLRVGDFDLWNPSANGGYASAYYYQVLPQLASAIPTAIFGHHLFWFELSVFLPHVLAPAAAYKGMRLLGATPWQAVAAAFAIAFTNGESRWGAGNAGTFQVGLYTQTWALAAFPLALGYGARWISQARGLAAAIAWGAFVGLCHPFAVVVLGVALFVSVIAKLVPHLEPLRWPSVVGRAIAMVGLAELVVLPRTWAKLDTGAWGVPAYVPIAVASAIVVAGAVLLGLAWVKRASNDAWKRTPASRVGFALMVVGLGLSALAGFAAVNGSHLAKGADGPLPSLVIYIVSGLVIAGGLALPVVIRPPETRWVRDVRRPEGLGFRGWIGRAVRHPTAVDTNIMGELSRTVVLGVLMILAWMPVWLPLLADYNGFGGFPSRVWDEVGPGFDGLATWYRKGLILDFAPPGMGLRIAVLTFALPIVLLLCRDRMMRWLWPAALLYALLLGLGPHLGKIGDDLFPPVRALGAMQIVLALGIGAGALIIGRRAWRAEPDTFDGKVVRIVLAATTGAVLVGLAVGFWFAGWAPSLDAVLARWLWSPGERVLRVVAEVIILGVGAGMLLGVIPLWRELGKQYGARTGLCAVAAMLLVLVAVPGYQALFARVHVLEDYQNNYRDEMMQINADLGAQPPGRKQTGPGAENHWWNLLSYVYDRVPSTLQMGGGGLQASPNYDFLWWTTTQYHDYLKNAWVYDAPYVVFNKAMGSRIPEGQEVAHTEHYEIRKLPAPGLVSPVQVVDTLGFNAHVDTPAKAWAHFYVDTIGVLPPGYHSHQLGREAALEWLRGDQPIHDQVLAYIGSEGVTAPPEAKLLRAWHQDSPGDEPDIVAEVEATKPATFVIRESWHPRWHAYLDGEEVRVRRVTPDFPAVDVPAGKHTIALRFERPWWALLAWLAWPGVSVLAWLALRRRKPAPAPPTAA